MEYSNMKYSTSQLLSLILLRIAIGWHLLYEGIAKWMNPKWSAKAYLMDAKGFLSDFYYSLAQNDSVLIWVDWSNKVGLTLIGFSLISGLLSRWATFMGIFLLALYYLSHIPMVGVEYLIPSEGSYLWVDKNLIEIFALLVCAFFPTSHYVGLDRLIRKSKK
jgi:thiosulfate dehydrogenase [quinone] large subunit